MPCLTDRRFSIHIRDGITEGPRVGKTRPGAGQRLMARSRRKAHYPAISEFCPGLCFQVGCEHICLLLPILLSFQPKLMVGIRTSQHRPCSGVEQSACTQLVWSRWVTLVPWCRTELSLHAGEQDFHGPWEWVGPALENRPHHGGGRRRTGARNVAHGHDSRRK